MIVCKSIRKNTTSFEGKVIFPSFPSFSPSFREISDLMILIRMQMICHTGPDSLRDENYHPSWRNNW